MSSPTMVSVFQKESGCNLASEVLCDESSLLEESTYITGRLVPLSQYIQNETESGPVNYSKITILEEKEFKQ